MSKKAIVAVLSLALCATSAAQAGMSPVTMRCVAHASRDAEVSENLVLAVMAAESGSMGFGHRTIGRGAVGPMQVNARVWVPTLAEMEFGGNRRRADTRLRHDGCYNVSVGAWILRQKMDDAHGNVSRGIVAYHGGPGPQGWRYLSHVRHNLRVRFQFPQR